MRLPLRSQILLPMVGILLLTVIVVSALNAWLASMRVRQQVDQQLADVSQTLSASSFPLESNVLRQMRGLTAADYVVVDASGKATAASDDSLAAAAEKRGLSAARLRLSNVATIQGRRFFHVAMPLDRRAIGLERLMLHVFYSEAAWREARWQAIWPPLAIGAASVALVAIVVSLVAQRVTRPIRDLHLQVGRIAQGDFQAIPIPTRDDEVKDLATAVNQMAERLAQYEDQIRKNERLRALGTLGGGIAHQIRNAATGCRMALDLHQRDCPLAAVKDDTSEPLGVAVRQLVQIETYIQRFLALGRPAVSARTETNLTEVTSHALDLVRPMALHMGVGLEASAPEEPAMLPADAQSLTQMVVNLVVNAVEAAAHSRRADSAASGEEASVAIRLTRIPDGHYELAIGNPGLGPSPEIQPRLFEPFATDKPGGTGLGLAVARQIAQDHGGSIRWEQREGETWFCVILPCADSGAS